jgi:hypothetical protein
MPSYAADEELAQVQFSRGGKAGAKRLVASDYFFVRFREGARDTAEFRDVVVVDGKIILSAAARSAKWPKLAAARTSTEFAALVEGVDKYRLAPEHFEGLARLASRFATRHHDKMKYFFAPDTSDPPSSDVLIGYRQVAGEGLMAAEDKSVFPNGQAWVNPNDGHINRIEEEFRVKDTLYYLAVEFIKPDELGAWVPQQITVRLIEKGRMAFENVYAYSNFRRLDAPSNTATAPQ